MKISNSIPHHQPEIDLDFKIDLTGLYDAECGTCPCSSPIRDIARLRGLEHPDALTDAQSTKLRARMLALKTYLEGRPRPRFIRAYPPPIYDEIFEDGVRWLDGDGGTGVPPGSPLDLVGEAPGGAWARISGWCRGAIRRLRDGWEPGRG